MTLEELEAHVLNLESDYNQTKGLVGEFEKELAILKGRTDGLEAITLSLQTTPWERNRATVAVVTEYDIREKDNDPIVRRSSKVLKGNAWYNQMVRSANNDTAIFGRINEPYMLIEEDNSNGIYPSINKDVYDLTSVTGKDLAVGNTSIQQNSLVTWGMVSRPEGGTIFHITRQKLK
jgi:phosphate-selective porin